MAEHGQVAPAALGAQAVGGDVDLGLQLQVFVELAVGQARLALALALQILADAGLADIDPVRAVFERGALGEQVGRLVPQAAVDIVAVGALQLAHGAGAFQPVDLGRQLVDLGVDRRGGVRGL